MDGSHPTPVVPDDAELAGAHSPRAKHRDSLFLTARLTLGAAAPTEVRVRNLSAGGLMVEWPYPVIDGTAATLVLRGLGAVTGRVAWCTQGRVGIAFDAAIDPLLARKPVGGGTGTPIFAKPALDAPPPGPPGPRRR